MLLTATGSASNHLAAAVAGLVVVRKLKLRVLEIPEKPAVPPGGE